MHFDTLQAWLQWQENLHPKSIDLGLTRVQQVFARLQPNYQKPITITVAGTNGKGSSVAMLEAIYRAQGLRVGAYTSPHIIRYNERIKINGLAVDDLTICQAFERIEAARQDISLSYFEFSTLAALDIFSQQKLDIQLLEVGLGGRLDAVNLIDADAAIITSICIDHTDWLGDTREAIGIEKAGVLRANIPAIIGDIEPPQSLLDCVKQKNAQLLRLNHEFCYQKQTSHWQWQLGEKILNNLPLLNLKGEHQYRNASSVLTAVHCLQDKLAVSEQAIHYGLSHAELSGRFQLIQHAVPVLLDVSHNPQAAQSLVDYLSSDFNDRPIHALFTMMSDKDMQGVINIMQPIIHQWYITPLDNPRTTKENDTLDIFNKAQIPVKSGFEDFLSAFYHAEQQAIQDNGLILIFGSFFLVSEYLSHFSSQP